MIDTKREEAITLAKAAGIHELRRNGRPPHIASMFRWSTRGCRGVVLETIQIAGNRCTSREAVARFLHRLNGGDAADALAPTDRTEEHERSVAALKIAGVM